MRSCLETSTIVCLAQMANIARSCAVIVVFHSALSIIKNLMERLIVTYTVRLTRLSSKSVTYVALGDKLKDHEVRNFFIVS